MYLLVKFGNQRSYRNGDISSHVLTWIPIGRFSKSGIPIHNSKAPGDRKTRRRSRRRSQAIAKRYAFHANAKDSTLALFKFNSKDTSTSVALEYIITP